MNRQFDPTGSGLTSTNIDDAIKEASTKGTLLSNRIVVNQSNVSSTLGGVIDSSKEYFLDGQINMGTIQVTVPTTGINIAGYNFDVSGLYSTEDNYTMFISDVMGSGNFIAKDYSVSVNGTNSKVYNLNDATGFNAFEF